MDDLDLNDDESLVRLLRESRQLQDAPEALIRRMVALAGPMPQAEARSGLGEAVRRLIQAVLSFDSWAPGLALEGVRAAGSDARQLMFEAGDHDVDVRVRRSAAAGIEGWSVSGQVLGPDGAGRIVLRCGGVETEAPWNALGEFRFEPVPHGDCRLLLEGDGWSAELPAFVLPSASKGADG